MEGWNPEGTLYLHIAYAAIIACNVMYAGWVAYRWSRTKKAGR